MGNAVLALARRISRASVSSETLVEEYELRLLKIFVRRPIWRRQIGVDDKYKINTIFVESSCNEEGPPIVLLHGMFEGLAVWSVVLDTLSVNRRVFALDLPGLGRSSAEHNCMTTMSQEEAEQDMVRCLEEWRRVVDINEMILVGRGVGGYLATLYARSEPHRVRQLILVDPSGFEDVPLTVLDRNYEECSPYNYYETSPLFDVINDVIGVCFLLLWRLYSVLCISSLSFLVRYWTWMADMVRFLLFPRILRCTGAEKRSSIMTNYIAACSVLSEHCENLWRRFTILMFWAKVPLIYRIKQMDVGVPISFVYGGKRWCEHRIGHEAVHLRLGSFVDVYTVHNSCRDALLDDPQGFLDVMTCVMFSDSASFQSSVSAFVAELGRLEIVAANEGPDNEAADGGMTNTTDISVQEPVVDNAEVT